MDKNELIRACEAVIFSSGEPISVKRLAEVFELSAKKAEDLVKAVEEHIKDSNLGFELLRLDDSVQLATKQEYAPSIITALAIKRKAPLSPAALEVLAVIAYNQPSTKAFIEQVRGVDCSGVISTLIEKELIEAIDDGIDRLLMPSIENEIRSDLSDRAHTSSIEVFSLNLEKLLSQPPLKGRIVLGFDPGFYNGCKLAVLDETGKMLTVDKIFPFRKDGDIEGSNRKLLALIKKYGVQIIAIGNGTASRESEKLVAELIHNNGLDVSYAIVSEAGASVWSAQEAARAEFPDMAVGLCESNR